MISKRKLRAFCETRKVKKEWGQALYAWHAWAERSDWATPEAIRRNDASSGLLLGNRVVFNVKGNLLRVVVKINYPARIVYIRFVGTHTEYDKIDATEI